MELRGLKHLHEHHNLNLMQVMAASFQHYLNYGNNYTTPGDTAGEGILSLDRMVNSVDSMIRLPVCVSKYVEMGDVNRQGISAKFPFSCGDFTGNETKDFFERLFLAKGQRDYDLKMAHELFERTSTVGDTSSTSP